MPAGPRARPRRAARSARSRARPSCCRSRAPRTSRWSLVGRLGLARARPGGPQELRGRASRRDRGGAVRRPAPRDRRGARRVRPQARRGGGAVVRAAGDRGLRSSGRSRAGSAARGDRGGPARRGRWRWSPPTGPRRSAGAATPPRRMGSRSAWRRRPRWLRRLAQRRNLTAARARGFTRDQANLLSRTVALPVIVGATALKGVRLRTARGRARTRRRAGRRRRRGVRVDARLAAPDHPGRARPRAVAVRGLPHGAGGRRRGENGER